MDESLQIELKMRLMLTLRRAGIRDQAVLAAIEQTPRDWFVEESFAERAWDDMPLPLPNGQTISQPSVVAKMTEALEPAPRLKVLEIGTGSGYQTAILSRLFRRVYSIERHERLAKQANKLLQALNLTNITAITGDGTLGWPSQAPFDRIIITAAAEDVPATLLAQLKPGGILVAPVGPEDELQQLIKVEKTDTEYHYQELIPVRFVPLLEGIAKG